MTADPPASPAPLPEGTLTLLFSDIEGSTGLLARLGERYAEVLSLQRRIQRAAFARHGGHEMGTEGDSFFVVFTTAAAAVSAALEAQRELADATWPDGAAVRVRMGLHTGEPRRHEDGYVGMDVHRAARVAAAAHGGQVLVTGATRALGHAVPGAGFQDLGEHRLKDLPGTTRLHQLLGEGLPVSFPPPRSLGSSTTVPRAVTSLVGREEDVARLAALLTGPGGVVTVTGPGGVGKTRLAAAVAADVGGRFADGVYLVLLASVRETEVMWSTVAEALGVAEEDRGPTDLLDRLATRNVLLVLDNLEQLPGAPAVVDRLARAGGGVRVLATSRRPLHVPGEHEHPLTPLDLPGPDADPATAAASPAVDLFLQRARLVRPGLVLDEHNVADVVALCRQLDGLPLAIELVAARARLLGPRALHARVGESLGLSATTIDAPDRQRTLRATIAWSYDLLPPDLSTALRALSVLDGDFDLAAVGAVVADGADPLDLVTRLVDASLLLVREGPDGEPVLRLMRTVAAFGRERLAEAGEEDDVRRRHARHYLALAAETAPRLGSAAHLTARDRLTAALDNLRAALAWSLGTDERGPADLRTGLALCEQLAWFWYACGYQREGRRWLAAAVDAAAEEESPELMTALHGLGVLVLQHGDAERARAMFTRALEHRRRSGDRAATSSALNSLALAMRALGEPAAARTHLEEAVALARETGSAEHLANALSNLAALEIDAGHHDQALTLLRETLELDRTRGDAWGIAAGEVNTATALLRAGRLDGAARTLAEHGPGVVALQDDELTVEILEIGCALAARRGDARRAARLLGASSALRARAELAIAPTDRDFLEQQVAAVRRDADPGTWGADVDDGARAPQAEVLAEALAVPEPR